MMAVSIWGLAPNREEVEAEEGLRDKVPTVYVEEMEDAIEGFLPCPPTNSGTSLLNVDEIEPEMERLLGSPLLFLLSDFRSSLRISACASRL